jgi:hypothetical protein
MDTHILEVVKILLHLQIGVGAEKILLIKVTHILEVVKILLLLQIGVGAEKILLIKPVVIVLI